MSTDKKLILDMEAKGSFRIKPWSCAKVNLRIFPADRGQYKRRNNLQRLKEVASAGICNAPYVEVLSDDVPPAPYVKWKYWGEQELAGGGIRTFPGWWIGGKKSLREKSRTRRDVSLRTIGLFW